MYHTNATFASLDKALFLGYINPFPSSPFRWIRGYVVTTQTAKKRRKNAEEQKRKDGTHHRPGGIPDGAGLSAHHREGSGNDGNAVVFHLDVVEHRMLHARVRGDQTLVREAALDRGDPASPGSRVGLLQKTTARRQTPAQPA